MPNVITLNNVSKLYGKGELAVKALDGVSVTVAAGEFIAVAGPSGSGKSTMLQLIGGLDTATQGELTLKGKSLQKLSTRALREFRRDHIGYIFSGSNLIPVLSVAENVEYVMHLQGIKPSERKARVMALLREIGLGGLEARRPRELTSGQQQRVAVARAMVSGPDVILADEPTANLDSQSASELLDLMRELNEKKGMTFVFSTHDPLIMARARRVVYLKDGKVERIITNS